MSNKFEKGFVKFIDSLAVRVYGPYTECSFYQPKTPQRPCK